MEQDQNGNVIVARVLAGSTIDEENLMHPGDVILEVNGVNVGSAEELTEIVSHSESTLQFRIASKNDSDQILKPQQVRAILGRLFAKVIEVYFTKYPENQKTVWCFI